MAKLDIFISGPLKFNFNDNKKLIIQNWYIGIKPKYVKIIQNTKIKSVIECLAS